LSTRLASDPMALPAVFLKEEQKMSFHSLGLRAELVEAVTQLGFLEPMPIQRQAIPALLAEKRDFIGLAQTGTGKTGAFGLPLIQGIDPGNPGVQAVVICPTRELCLQITGDLTRFAARMPALGIVSVYGGASIAVQIRQIKSGGRIVVATPGRLLDLIRRKALNLSSVSIAVLDEADEMLNMGFQEDIDAILAKMPTQRNIWLFSATMASGVAAIAAKYLADPMEVTVGPKNQSPVSIAHVCYTIREKDRYPALRRLIDISPEIFGLVFCRTRKDTQSVADALVRDGYPAEALHGDLSQVQRDAVMRKFRQGTIRLLVATDVAARGLDVEDITHVIHYNLPDEPEIYTHRSGRTGRAGKSGVSIALIHVREKQRILDLEKRGRIRFAFETLPDGKTVCGKKLLGLVDRFIGATPDLAAIAPFLPAAYEAFADLDKEGLIQRIVSRELAPVIEHYRHAPDLNVKSAPRPRAISHPTPRVEKRNDRVKPKKTERFFINVGRLDKINEGAIVRLICDHANIGSHTIGAIILNREFSFFEVETRAAAKVWNARHDARLDGRAVEIRKAFKPKAMAQDPITRAKPVSRKASQDPKCRRKHPTQPTTGHPGR
jgi:ATP-dependent RNA helicase DeaD